MNALKRIETQLELCKLKARHLRMVDTQDWEGYSTLVTEDFTLEIVGNNDIPVARGREQAVNQVRQSVTGAVTVHHAHMPEFDIEENEVRVIWAIHDRVVRSPDDPSFTLFGYHHDRWTRQNGEWKLAELKAVTHHLEIHDPIG